MNNATDMDFNLFKKVVSEAVEQGTETIIPVGMGDPFMDPGLGEKLAFIKTNYPSVQTVLSTTGHIIDMELIKYIDILKFSFYGITKKGYESVHRGAVKFEEALENIENVLRLPDGERPYTHMQYLVLPENEHEMEDWKKYWEGKADEMWIWKPATWSNNFYDYGWKPDYKNAIPCNRVFNPTLQRRVENSRNQTCKG